MARISLSKESKNKRKTKRPKLFFLLVILRQTDVFTSFLLVLELNHRELLKDTQKIHKSPDVIQRFFAGVKFSKEPHPLIAQIMSKRRIRLKDDNWFMRSLNKQISRQANFEDNCTGHLYLLPFMALTLRPAKAVQCYPLNNSSKAALAAMRY